MKLIYDHNLFTKIMKLYIPTKIDEKWMRHANQNPEVDANEIWYTINNMKSEIE